MRGVTVGPGVAMFRSGLDQAPEDAQVPEQTFVYVTGTFHLAGADAISWHGFATAIFDLAGFTVEVDAIGTVDYPTPAPRPANSRLDSDALAEATGVRLPGWTTSLPGVVTAILDSES